MKISFPFHYITTNSFGRVFRPYVTISVFRKHLGIYISQTVLVDTGSDFTIFPQRDARLFGIDLAKETQEAETCGIGGTEKVFLYKDLTIKLGGIELQIPVGFLNHNNVPALLGRQRCLERFKVSLEDHVTVFRGNVFN